MTVLTRVQLHELWAEPALWDEELWIDHVLYDIPETVAAGIRNAYVNVKRFTIHEDLWRMRHKYRVVFEVAEERGAELWVALRGGGFQRVPLAYFTAYTPL